MTSEKAIVGLAGVHYVAFQLSSRGLVTGLTGPGTRAIDLLAGSADTGKSITIQVKTGTDAHVDIGKPRDRWKWRVGRHLAEAEPSRQLFVAFVNLRGGPPVENDASWDPEVFIVPSGQLQKYVWGFPDKDPRDYWFVIELKESYRYRNRWDLIETALT